MDGIPIEYRDRMLAEQMAMMEALHIFAQFLIYFALLVAFVILAVNLVEAVRQNAWQGGVAKWIRRRSAKPLNVGSIPAAASRPPAGSDNEFDTGTQRH
jgi:hypothetical protein